MYDLDHQIITTLLGLYLLLSWPVGAVSLARGLGNWMEPGSTLFVALWLFLFLFALGPIAAVYGAFRMPYLLLRWLLSPLRGRPVLPPPIPRS